MTELARIFCERLVLCLPLPSQKSVLYFRLHCRLAGWAMFLGDNTAVAANEERPF